jgi:hypothetical protein
MNFDDTQDVQFEAGRCSGAADIIEGLLLDFADNPIVIAWAEDRLAETKEQMNQVESFARIMGG